MAKVLTQVVSIGRSRRECQSVQSRSGADSGGVQSSIKVVMRAANWM